MCTRSSAVVLPVAALLVMANIETPALAKPPGLPKNQKIICAPPAHQIRAGSLGGPVELILPAESVPSMRLEVEPADQLSGPKGNQAPLAEVTCPYLRQKAAESTEQAAETNVPSASVGENLEKLDKAQQYYHEAEYYRRHGCSNVARALYEEIRKLCPGSRYDRKAAVRLRRLEAQKTAEATDFANEEQELSPPPEATPPGQDDRETLPLPNSEASPQKNCSGAMLSQGYRTIRLGRLCLTLGLNQQTGRGSLLYGLGLASDGAAILQAAWQVLEDPVMKWIGALNEGGWSGDFSGAHY